MSARATLTLRWCLGLLALGVGVLLLFGRARPVPAEEEAPPSTGFKTLAAGLELGTVALPGPSGAAEATVLRIDPEHFNLELVGRFSPGGSVNHTAKEWAAAHGLLAAINAGMFAADLTTHLGYLRVNTKAVPGTRRNRYESVAAFDPLHRGTAPFRIFDLDAPGVSFEKITAGYGSVVQNLRLIKRSGENRWGEPSRRWSEAALAEDAAGRALFLFAKTPLAMQDFNTRLLKTDLGIVAAQHLEGGPQAQLYVRAGGEELELAGGVESFFLDPKSSAPALPIPWVLGARGR